MTRITPPPPAPHTYVQITFQNRGKVSLLSFVFGTGLGLSKS